MRKIVSGLRYGNAKTKAYIITTILLLMFGTVSLWMMIRTQTPLWGMSMFFSYIFAFLIISTFSFHKSGNAATKVKELKKASPKRKTHDDEEDTGTNNLNTEDVKEDEEIEEPEKILEQYDEAAVKKIMVRYKVNTDHKPIMIDACDSLGVSQCPAYVWINKKELQLLLFEKEPRKVSLPAAQAIVYYEKGASASPASDYPAFRKASFLSLVFKTYLPTVYEAGSGMRKIYKKNLYVLSPDLKVTNTSAATLLDMLQAEPTLTRGFTDPRMNNPYFEAAYKYSFMLRDGVITVTEFKNKLKNLLKTMAEAKIQEKDFQVNIDLMVENNLITKEYADYYRDYRKKQ